MIKKKTLVNKKVNRRILTDIEKEAHKMMKDAIKKPTILKAKYFKPGALIMFSYSAKYADNPYDATPVAFIIGRNRKYTWGINFAWVPPALRKGIIDMIMEKNKKNIANNKDLEVPKDLLKKIFRMGLPAFRKYLNNRISPKGVVVPYTEYTRIVHLRSEHFINISAEDAWKIAVQKIKKNKKIVARKDRGYK